MTTTTATPRVRARDLGVDFGGAKTGRWNAITDVAGVKVGHVTLIDDDVEGGEVVSSTRTGVTAILPRAGNVFMERVVGGGFVLNGAGEVAGLTQVMEWGLLESPILLTNTLAVGACSDAVVQSMLNRYPGIGHEHDVVIPIVGECDDSWLNDIGRRQIKAEHVFDAIKRAADGPVTEGNVGGGTGMITCDFKGGIGTSSRVLDDRDGGFTIGVLVMSNFGVMEDLRFLGVPIGRTLRPPQRDTRRENNYGSIIVVVATDAPLMTHQIGRLCKRAALGIGRVGSVAAHGSGEIIIGFSTANIFPRGEGGRTYHVDVLNDAFINPLYSAVIDTTEEAILNAICMSEDMTGLHGRTVSAIPVDVVRSVVRDMHASLERLRPS